jgi:tetratricopeptide (TPR) repeat protein
MRALDLLPDDYRIRCYAARTAYALGDASLLERLEADATAHLKLAYSHRRLARICASFERLSVAGHMRLNASSYDRYAQRCADDKGLLRSTKHYQLALQEYDEAIRREPMNIEALTGYALTVWEWLLDAGHDKRLRGWIDYYAAHALGHARKAVAMSSVATDGLIPALVRASLGNAFLAQGSPEYAVKELEKALEHVPNHPAFYEIHWALAQAYLCAAASDSSPGSRDRRVRPLEKRAIELLGNIRQQEGMREFQLYSYRPGVLESSWGSFICDASFRTVGLPDLPSTLKTTRASTPDIDRSTLPQAAQAQEPQPGLRVSAGQ